MCEFLAAATAIVREAGEIARPAFGKPTLINDKGRGDLVFQTDLEVNRHICSRLSRLFPDHGILSEESGEDNTSAEHVWILDPIDGSRYFGGGIPLYSISLALQREGDVILGVVFNPESDQLFTASGGKGAFLNGEPICCSQEDALKDATVCMEIPNRHYSRETNRLALGYLAELVDRVERVRIIGVSAIGLCYCATGGFDLYLNVSTASKLWDLAAGRIILSEAGATVETMANGHIVGGNERLCKALLQLLDL